MTSPSHPRVLTRRGGERARGERARGEQRARPRRCFIGDVIRQRSRTLSNAVQNLIEAYDIRNDVERVFKAPPAAATQACAAGEPSAGGARAAHAGGAQQRRAGTLSVVVRTSSYSFKRTFMIVWYALMTASPTATKTSFHNSWRTRTTSTKKPVFRAALPTGSSSSPGQGTPGAGEISSLVRILPTSFLIHLILILLMRRIQPLLQLCLV